jgi:hypothetical protein
MIEHNIIVQNWSQGNGAAMAGCYGTIRNNLIAGNAAELYGGGLYGCGGRIENNTITYNSAALDGGGLYSCDGTIVHCIIWGNTASNGAQLYSSSDPTYSCIQDWVGGGEGNTNNDPLFVDTDGADDDPETYGDNDYHLMPDSPCIDAGTNAVLNPRGLDLDGNLRIASGKGSLIVDMGAYEYNSRPFVVTQIGYGLGGGRRLVWNSQPNDTYTVWLRYDLSDGEWELIDSVASQGEESLFIDTTSLTWDWRKVFYRVDMEEDGSKKL